MQTRVISELINLATTSTMTSRHAAAVVGGRRILSMGTNYSLGHPKASGLLSTNELIEYAASINSFRGGSGGHSKTSSRSTSSDELYERHQCFEGTSLRASRLQAAYNSVQHKRYEKDCSFEANNPENWIGISATCGGKCFGEVSC